MFGNEFAPGDHAHLHSSAKQTCSKDILSNVLKIIDHRMPMGDLSHESLFKSIWPRIAEKTRSEATASATRVEKKSEKREGVSPDQKWSWQEHWPFLWKWWMRLASRMMISIWYILAINFVARSTNIGILFRVCFYPISRYIRQSPHTRRFFVIWITDGLGSWIRLKTIASFSLCPQSTDSIVSPSWRGRVIQLLSNTWPCSFSFSVKRSIPAIILGDSRWNWSWALNLWNAKTPLLSSWKILRMWCLPQVDRSLRWMINQVSFYCRTAWVDWCALLVLVVHSPRMNTCSREVPTQQSAPVYHRGTEISFDRTTAVRERDAVGCEYPKASPLGREKHFGRSSLINETLTVHDRRRWMECFIVDDQLLCFVEHEHPRETINLNHRFHRWWFVRSVINQRTDHRADDLLCFPVDSVENGSSLADETCMRTCIHHTDMGHFIAHVHWHLPIDIDRFRTHSIQAICIDYEEEEEEEEETNNERNMIIESLLIELYVNTSGWETDRNIDIASSMALTLP